MLAQANASDVDLLAVVAPGQQGAELDRCV